MVSIIDEGVDIPEKETDMVFEKFSQSSRTKTNASGTGLRLSICKQIINAYHGKICAENNLGGEATFNFSVPVKQC